MYRLFLQQHSMTISILLFIFVYYAIQCCSPGFLYKNNGQLRNFGIGYKEKTIFPAWLVAVVFAIFSYICVKYIAHF